MAMRGRRTMRIGMVAALAGMLGQPALAFLDTGTLLTNSASATYSAGVQGTSVTYSATAKILVANPAVFLYKEIYGGAPTAYISPTGGTVTYTICFSNGGANTAFNVTIKDRLPNNTFWSTSFYSAWAVDLTGAAYVPAMSWSLGGSTWQAGTPPAGGQMGLPNPSSQAGFIQWIVPTLGVGRSGCVIFSVELR